jgi:hypothetical protein
MPARGRLSWELQLLKKVQPEIPADICNLDSTYGLFYFSVD